MVLAKHLHTGESTAFMVSVVGSLSVLWHIGVTMMTWFRDFLGLSITFHTVLQLCKAMLHQLMEDAPSSGNQVDEVKRSDKELLIFPWFGRVDRTIERSGLQYRSMQQDNLINSQLNLTKFNSNNKGTSKSPITSEDNTQLSPEENYSQYYLNKSNQDHFRDEDTCSDDDECVSVNHLSSHCLIPKNSTSPTEWSKVVSNGEEYIPIYNEEWDDSEEDSDSMYSSDDSFSGESDQELNEVSWKSFFAADPYNPLNFTACLTSSSTNIYSNPQSLKECENGRKNLTKVKLSTLQKPVLSQRHVKHFCKHGTGENVRFCTWKKSAKSIKSEGENKEVEKSVVKKVRFSPFVEVHKMVTWSFASREARRGQWMQMAQDRTRFLHKIQDTEQAIDYCLQRVHRKKIWERNSQANQI
ncbi:protein phosphatase 1 regulatory subunit 15B [Carcharodon carcharias]|uniref:protein phosphatase 1 regulatory subunit 15B n=1 Tax=Carcharodon carcharias TaxID=13397 RepID=UPI001B7E62DC|nr:protein phosphatase 1 regulatory subunit 15B [Carcharodon carcharias]